MKERKRYKDFDISIGTYTTDEAIESWVGCVLNNSWHSLLNRGIEKKQIVEIIKQKAAAAKASGTFDFTFIYKMEKEIKDLAIKDMPADPTEKAPSLPKRNYSTRINQQKLEEAKSRFIQQFSKYKRDYYRENIFKLIIKEKDKGNPISFEEAKRKYDLSLIERLDKKLEDEKRRLEPKNDIQKQIRNNFFSQSFSTITSKYIMLDIETREIKLFERLTNVGFYLDISHTAVSKALTTKGLMKKRYIIRKP